jgi:hypothetical protein
MESIPAQVLAVASQCEQRNVRVLELSVTPWGDHIRFYGLCSAGRTLAYEVPPSLHLAKPQRGGDSRGTADK